MKPEISAKEIKQLVDKLGGPEKRGGKEILAAKCSVSHQAVYQWLKGVRPQKSNLKSIRMIIDELNRAGVEK